MKKIIFVLIVLFFLLGCTQQTICGDSICNTSEDSLNCTQDCDVSPYCGDKVCGENEDYLNCLVDCNEPINHTFRGSPKETFENLVKEKMIWDLPELNGFIYTGVSSSESDIDLRYIPSANEDQHSEYWWRVFSTPEEANKDNFLEGEIITLNGNIIYEVVVQEDGGVNKQRAWVSGNNVLVGWNGNDLGTIYDNNLFDLLTNAYLLRYPSTLNSDLSETKN